MRTKQRPKKWVVKMGGVEERRARAVGPFPLAQALINTRPPNRKWPGQCRTTGGLPSGGQWWVIHTHTRLVSHVQLVTSEDLDLKREHWHACYRKDYIMPEKKPDVKEKQALESNTLQESGRTSGCKNPLIGEGGYRVKRVHVSVLTVAEGIKRRSKF